MYNLQKQTKSIVSDRYKKEGRSQSKATVIIGKEKLCFSKDQDPKTLLVAVGTW